MDEQDETPAPAASAPTQASSATNKSIPSPPGSEPASPSSSSSSSSAEAESVSEAEAAPGTKQNDSVPKSRANDSEDESEDDVSEQESDDDETDDETQLDIPSLRSRLASFIPRIAAANRRLAHLETMEAATKGRSGEAKQGDKRRKRKRDGFEIVSLEDTDDAAARESGPSKRARAEKEEHVEEQGDGEDGDASSEEGPYIEMDLGLGVLEEKPTQAGREPGDILFRAPEEAKGSESDTTGDEEDSDAASEGGNVMEKLMAIGSSKAKQRKKPSAQGQISEAPND